MPALLMHIQAADQIRKDGLIPEIFREPVDRATWAYGLGSVLVDLPLFDRFWLKVGLFLVRQPYPESRWASVIHARGTASLTAALLERASEATEQGDALNALGAGLLTHLAFDRAMHPAIEDAVRRHLRPSETKDQLHEKIENFQCMDWHRTHLDCDGLGTSLLRDGVGVGPTRSPTMPTWLVRSFRDCLERAYTARPRAAEIQRWCAGMCGYRDLMSTKVAAVSIRSSERFAAHRPWVREVALEETWEHGLNLARDYLQTAATERNERSGSFIETIGDGPLV